ncbi:Ankyrin-2 [Diplodia seriata]|uniref:Ankyrin-2 n=1 Tax=Diplodia seriata TaxID=420778 RepID=A0A1S8BMU6_9PEZI|nr:Ankyrin-2 [Diplodia seriata]
MSWLTDREMLPKALPTAKITSFGLDVNDRISSNAPIDLKFAATEVLKEFLKQRDGEGSRSIVFIGHGYGTIVIEHLLFGELLDTVEENARLRIVESTAAVAMFAPPLESFNNLIDWMGNNFNIPRTSKLFEARKTSNDRAPNVIWDEFFTKTKERNIATFGYLEQGKESKKTKGSDAQTRNVLNNFDRHYTCDTDVENIARIGHAKDIRFRTLTNAISEFVGVHQLLQASRIHNEDFIDDLLGASVDFNFESGRRQTVLHLAAEQGLDRLVKSLINSGKVDLDRQDIYGNTALHISIGSSFSHSPDMVWDLLKAGANTGVKNLDGASPETMALEEKANIFIKGHFEKRPLVEGPIGPRTLVRGNPGNPNARAACSKTGMVAREIFKPTESKPDRHLPVYKSVHDFVYTDENIDSFFRAAHHENPGIALCRWYHIPMNNIEHLLDLKQKQANLWEARSSREGAEEAAKQGKTILVFTIITIIFLPLSFMSSFFSLGVSIFPKEDGENDFPLGWVAALLFGVSFAVSIPFVILAFNIGKFSEVWSRITHSANKYTAFILLKPLRGSQRLPSRHIRSKCQEWYREWVNFIAKHDLPLKPDEEMEAQLKREMDDRQAPEGETPDAGFYTDSSSDGEVTDDEEELDLAVRQTERQINLLQWMRG